MNTARNAAVKAEPPIVATSLVKRFSKAVKSSTRKTHDQPEGDLHAADVEVQAAP